MLPFRTKTLSPSRSMDCREDGKTWLCTFAFKNLSPNGLKLVLFSLEKKHHFYHVTTILLTLTTRLLQHFYILDKLPGIAGITTIDYHQRTHQNQVFIDMVGCISHHHKRLPSMLFLLLTRGLETLGHISLCILVAFLAQRQVLPTGPTGPVVTHPL